MAWLSSSPVIPLTYSIIINNHPAISENDLLWLLTRDDYRKGHPENPISEYGEIKFLSGVAKLEGIEIKFLWRAVKNLPVNANIVKIGRYVGGSTILIGMAMSDTARFTSIDIDPYDDEMLQTTLNYYGIDYNIELITADANNVSVELDSIDLLFVDGDHRYPGVLKNYEHWKNGIKKEGHLLFHDAFDFLNVYGIKIAAEGVHKLCQEIITDDKCHFKLYEQCGSIAHFIRR